MDAIAGDAPVSEPGKSDATKGEAPVATGESGSGQKTETPTSIVMPLEIAALLLPHTFGARGLGGNAHAPGQRLIVMLDGADGDLAARCGRRWAVIHRADNILGDDDKDPDGVVKAARFGLAHRPDFAPGEPSDGDAHAQAVISSALPRPPAGPQRLAAARGIERQHYQNVVDDLLGAWSPSGPRRPPALPVRRGVVASTSATYCITAPAFAADTAATSAARAAIHRSSIGSCRRFACSGQWRRQVRITLEPQHFGELTVSLRVRWGQVVARLQADTPVIREWLQANQRCFGKSGRAQPDAEGSK